jgi:protein gp37
MSAKYWREPLRWNRKGRARVFSGSMCDVFEAHPEPEVRAMQDAARDRLWELIEGTPDLTWMLLTKRPGNIAGLAPATGFPRNVWLGTSVEDQTSADERIPQLLAVPAAVHFLSCEPLLGPVDLNGPADQDGHRRRLTYWLTGRPEWGATETTATGLQLSSLETGAKIGWVIAGGESGRKARPVDQLWVRSLRDQAVAARVPFHFKQWGQWAPDGNHPDMTINHSMVLCRSKEEAGRVLDGRTWDEFPTNETGWPL